MMQQSTRDGKHTTMHASGRRGGGSRVAGAAGGVGNAGKKYSEQINNNNAGKETFAARFFLSFSQEEKKEP